MTGKYLGQLRTEATHIKSNNKIITDAPIDNNGKGEAFSPTDLLCASLASCMITIAGISANTHQIFLGEVNWEITKIMGTEPRRVVEIGIKFYFPNNQFSEKDKAIIMRAALNCPVAKSLSTDIKQDIAFIF